MIVLFIIGFIVLAFIVGAFMQTPECEVCGAPIYHTSSGWRHKPGHAPGDKHKAQQKIKS